MAEKNVNAETAEKKAKKAAKGGFLHSVAAERKKITWYSGKQGVSSTVAVVVTMVVVALVIGLVDMILGKGVSLIGSLGNLFA